MSAPLSPRTSLCTVVLANGAPSFENQVITLNGQKVECFVYPHAPDEPLTRPVERLDLSSVAVGSQIKIIGIRTNDTIFGASISTAGEFSKAGEVKRSEEWESNAREIIGQVVNKKFRPKIAQYIEMKDVYVQPETPPIVGVTEHFPLGQYEGKWLKFRAVFDRDTLWGAVLLNSDLPDPDTSHRDRILDTDPTLQLPSSPIPPSADGKKIVLLGLNSSESSLLLAEFVLREMCWPNDFVRVIVQISEQETLQEVADRKRLVKNIASKAKDQSISCSVTVSIVEPKATLAAEAERLGAKVIITGVQDDSAHDSIFNVAVSNYLEKQFPDTKMRKVKIPSARYFEAIEASSFLEIVPDM